MTQPSTAKRLFQTFTNTLRDCARMQRRVERFH